MAGVQALMQAKLDWQIEETRRILRENKDEPIAPVVQPNLNEEQSEEGNYSWIVSQVEPRVVRIKQPNGGNNGYVWKYKDFRASKPLSLTGNPTLVEVMD